jgi:type II secretory pathway component PulC
MKNIINNSLISFAIALLLVAIIGYFVTIPTSINLRDVKVVTVDASVSSALDIKDKVIVKKTVNSTVYLNAWKLSATVIGKTSFAMVLKGRNSKILKLDDTLEGYKVSKINKDKVLFSKNTDDIWLYVKTKKLKINNAVHKVVPLVGTYTMRKATFKRNILKPERLLKIVNIVPDMKSGRFEGMKVVSLLEGSFLYMYGLRKDDVIKRINGKRLLSIADGINGYQNIASSSKFTISVLRDNKIEEFKYEIVK